jgi:hypothetical protein
MKSKKSFSLLYKGSTYKEILYKFLILFHLKFEGRGEEVIYIKNIRKKLMYLVYSSLFPFKKKRKEGK